MGNPGRWNSRKRAERPRSLPGFCDVMSVEGQNSHTVSRMPIHRQPCFRSAWISGKCWSVCQARLAPQLSTVKLFVGLNVDPGPPHHMHGPVMPLVSFPKRVVTNPILGIASCCMPSQFAPNLWGSAQLPAMLRKAGSKFTPPWSSNGRSSAPTGVNVEPLPTAQ